MSCLRRIFLFAFVCLILTPLLPAQRIISQIGGEYDTYGMDLNSVTNRIFVTSEIDNSLVVIDGATNQVVANVPIGRGGMRPTVDSVHNKIYVPNNRDNTLTVVDGVTFATSTVNVGLTPRMAAVNPVTNKIYVANANGNTVTVIDGATLATTTIDADEGPLAIAVNTVTNKIYVGNQRFSYSTITVIDGATNHTTTVALPFPAYFYTGRNSLIVNESTNQIYALWQLGLVGIDGASNTVYEIQGWSGRCVDYMVLNPVTNHMYGADCGGVDDIDLSTQLTNQISTWAENEFISIDTTRNRIYTLDPLFYVLTAIDLNTGAQTVIQTGIDSEDDIVTNSNTNTTYFGAFFGVSSGTEVLAGATPMQFVPLQPCRILDTRGGDPIQGGSTANISLISPGCHIPATASAFSLNVTLVPSGGPVGYLTIWPTDQLRPTISTMNSPDGRIKANAAVVPAGTLNNVSIYVSDTTNLLLDIDGYFAPAGQQTLEFYPLTPCRVIDTRGAAGDLGGPYLTGGHPRNFLVRESSCIPSNSTALAYSFNFTAVPHGGPMSYLTVWPQGQPMPLVSTLNNYTATTVANAAIVPSGEQGGISVYPSANTDLVVDIDGYFAPPQTGGLSLYALQPCRVLDTRGGDGAFQGELSIDVTSHCLIPSAAKAYVLNATVAPPGPLGYLTLWPDGQQQPEASTLNASDGWITSNMAIVPSGNRGYIDAYASGLTQLILDISSYFAP
jgi:YVTN family beta-propeller protein